MIRSQREYETRKAFVAGMEEAVARADSDLAGQPPLLAEAMWQGQRSLLAEARAEIAEYEALRDGRLTRLTLETLLELGAHLRQARLAAGLTTAALAARAGLELELVARYETSDYCDAPLGHFQAVLSALGGRVQLEALIPARPVEAAPGPPATQPAAR